MDEARNIIVKQLGVNLMESYGHNTLADELDLTDDLGMDSLDLVELTMTFEEEFGVEIADDDATGWKTVGDIISYLKVKVA